MQHTAECQIIIRHITVRVWITMVRSGRSRVVVRQLDGDQRRHGLFPFQPLLRELTFKLIAAQLIGHVGVISCVIATGAAVQRLLHRHHHRMRSSGGRIIPFLPHMRSFIGLSEVVKRNALAHQGFPQAARLGKILGIHTARRSGESPARRRREYVCGLTGVRICFHPFVRDHSHHPVMPVDGGVAVTIKIIRERKLSGDLMMIRRHIRSAYDHRIHSSVPLILHADIRTQTEPSKR